MVEKYFTIEFTPLITAANQHVGAYTSGDVLWGLASQNKIHVPSGPAKLVGATAIVKSKGDANPTPNNFAFDLVFSTEIREDDDGNTVHSSQVTGGPNNDIVGSMSILATDYIGVAATQSITVATASTTNVVLNRGTQPCTVVADRLPGYDTYYVGGVADGAFNFSTIIRINDDDIATTSPGTTLVTDGTSMDIREHFVVGDILHAHDNAVIGTVASITNTTTLELTKSINTGVLAANDYVYTINPIKIKLFFEK